MMFGAVGNPDRQESVRVIHSALATKVYFPTGEGPNRSGSSRRWITLAVENSLRRFRTEQPPYSLLARGVETSVLPVAQRYGMGVPAWSPLASGFLTGRCRKGQKGQPVDPGQGRAALTPHRCDPALPENVAKLDAVEEFTVLADEIGCTLPEPAVAFAAAHPAVSSVIIGPRTMERLEGLLKGASVVLTEPSLRRRPWGERAAA
ncbi:aldo/keto reductase [Streptomyces sp. NPDC088915]|uniref:aldo/keto reductase n=1 Tax=Streptomyces sp. NPDC088915 TaxID=3365912 RepID=UPI00380E439D